MVKNGLKLILSCQMKIQTGIVNLKKKRMSFCVDEKANKKIEKSIMLC